MSLDCKYSRIDEYVTVIIRTVGERTEKICYEFVKKQINEANIHVVEKTPFTEALKETYKVGISENRKWTLVIDSDVILKENSVSELFFFAESSPEDVFLIVSKVIDKFLFNLNPREGGIHIYRTSLLHIAIDFIPDNICSLRPESYVKDRMKEIGYPCNVVDSVIGIHDFDQYYCDIYRKCFIHSQKHHKFVFSLLPQWEQLSKKDNDFKVALAGFHDGIASEEFVGIDKRSSVFSSSNVLKKLKLIEKDDISFQDLEKITNLETQNEILDSLELCYFSHNYIFQNVKGISLYISIGISNVRYRKNIYLSNPKCSFYICKDTHEFEEKFSAIKTTKEAILIDIDSESIDSIFFDLIKYLIQIGSKLRIAIHFNKMFDVSYISNIVYSLDKIGLDVYYFNDAGFRVYKLNKNSNDILNSQSMRSHIILYCSRKDTSFSFIYFLNSALQSGAELSAYDIVRKLISEYGIISTVIVPTKGNMISKFYSIGVPVLTVEYFWWTVDHCNKKEFINSIFNIILFKKQALNINPDIIFTQTIVIPWGAILATIINKPHIWNIREYGKSEYGLNFLFPFEYVKSSIKNFSDHITTCGKNVKRFFFGNGRNTKVNIAYSNIDEKIENTKTLQKYSKDITCLLPGTIIRGKGQLEAVMAISELVNKRMKKNIKLKIIGHISSEIYFEKILSFIKDEHLQSFVDILPFEPNIYHHYISSDLILNCSKCEAFGRVPMEGLMFYKPVIASNTGGNPEIIINKKNGLLYEQGDYVDLADKIEYFIKYPDEIKNMGLNGPETVKKLISKNLAEDVLYKAGIKLKSSKIKDKSKNFLDLLKKILDLDKSCCQKLYLHTEKVSNNDVFLKKIVQIKEDNSFRVVFKPNSLHYIKSATYNPFSKQTFKIRLDNINYTTFQGDIVSIPCSQLKSNGILLSNGYSVFRNSSPMIQLPISGSIEIIEIIGKLELIEKGEIEKIVLIMENAGYHASFFIKIEENKWLKYDNTWKPDYRIKKFSFRCDLSSYEKICSIRFNPVKKHFIRIKIDQIIEIRSGIEKKIKTSIIKGNGIKNINGYFEFDSLDPYFIIPTSPKVDSLKIDGEWDLLPFEETMNKYKSSGGMIYTSLFIDTGEGYWGKNHIKLKPDYKMRQFLLEYDLSNFENISSIRFDPVKKQFIRIKINQIIEIRSGIEKEIKTSTSKSNGVKNINGYFEFDSLDPYFIIPTSPKVDSLKIAGEWDLLPFEETMKNYISSGGLIFASLFIDTGEGYWGKNHIKLKPNYDISNFFVDFDLSDYPFIKHLRFDPIENQFIKIKISRIVFSKSNYDIDMNISLISSNGIKDNNNYFHFKTIDPQFFFPSMPGATRLRIIGEWYVLPFKKVIQENMK